MKNRAFTLVELLIVFSVIAVLATLTLSGVSVARDLVRNHTSSTRLDSVLTGLSQLGTNGEGTAAFIIQRDAGLQGVLSWRQPNDYKEYYAKVRTLYQTTATVTGATRPIDLVAQTKADSEGWSSSSSANYWTRANRKDPDPDRKYQWLNVTGSAPSWACNGRGNYYVDYSALDDLDNGKRPYMPFPWGKSRPEALVDTAVTPLPIAVDPFLLRWCSPYKTRELLALAEIIPKDIENISTPYRQYSGTTADYQGSSRSEKQTWNDAWGNPIVVSYAMYQPPKNDREFNKSSAKVMDSSGNMTVSVSDLTTVVSVSDPRGGTQSIPYNPDDQILKLCREKYQIERQLYVSVAAAGPNLPEHIKEFQTSTAPNQWNIMTEANWTASTQGGVLHDIWHLVAVGDPSSSRPPVCRKGSDTEPTNPYSDGSAYNSTLFPGVSSIKVWTGEWSERSWNNPPWQGILRAAYKDPTTNTKYTCFLSSPKDLK